MPIPLMVLICLAIGALVGCFNGLGISYFRIPAFIMTLGCMFMVRGFALKAGAAVKTVARPAEIMSMRLVM
ncbi:ribose ABC transporter permease, partial [Rhizobium leguminosarum]|uniref:ABC transporter permease subunit n=1 Tax=Rhizobium leguminosarum TaxID=384 RepID=UPI003F9ABEDB